LTAPADFDLRQLYAALDAQRLARELSWVRATSEINRHDERPSIHPISPSTVASLRTKAVAEADGVLQMLLWLNRTPESFVPDHQSCPEGDDRLPVIPVRQVLRFDTTKLHAAIDACRRDRSMTWRHAATEIGVSVSNLTHLASGGRTAFPHVMRMTRWLARPAAAFTHASDW